MRTLVLSALLLTGCSVASNNEKIKQRDEAREAEVRACLRACGDYVRAIVWEADKMVSCECYVAE